MFERDAGGFVTLNRSILQWRWYTTPNVAHLFIHLILKANHERQSFMGCTINRGQLVTSVAKLAGQTGLSGKSVRTALNHLKETGEVAIETTNRYSLITIVNYDSYQSKTANNRATKGQTRGKQRASKRATNNNNNNDNNDNNEKEVCVTHTPTRSEVEAFAREAGISTDVDGFLLYNSGRGWKGVSDWRPMLLKWASHDSDDKQKARDADPTIDEFGRPIKPKYR